MSNSSKQDPEIGPELARGVRDERQHWREQTLQGLIVSTFAASLFSSVWFLLVPYGLPRLTQALCVATLGLGILFAVRRHAPFGLRAAAFLLLLTAPCVIATLHLGINPNSLVGYAAAAVATAALLGPRLAVGAVGAAALAILAVSAVHSSGLLHQVPNWSRFVDSAHFANGVRAAGIFALLAGSTVVGVSYLLKRTEGLVWQLTQAFEALHSEQLEKERLRRDLELREAALLKARELETLGRLAGSMAHDFNNALLVISAAVDELCEDKALSADHATALTALRGGADQAAAATRSLRAFGPIQPRQPGLVYLASLIARARTTLERVLPRNIVLESDVRVDVAVAADEGELLRMLTNLVLNARDAMREGGTVTLRVRLVDEETQPPLVAVDVADTGSGIPEEIMQRLFEPFFTTKDVVGTGLGLATVRDLARTLGGDVRVQSELGRGTTITVLLPVASRSADGGTSPEPVTSGKDRVVLLVDDQPAVRVVLAKQLARGGFTVLQASGVSEGLEVLRRGKVPIDVLCTDGLMPGRPVRQLIDEFRRHHRGSVLVCSGYAPEEAGISPQDVDAFLAKPFTGAELLQRIHGLLTGRASELRPRA